MERGAIQSHSELLDRAIAAAIGLWESKTLKIPSTAVLAFVCLGFCILRAIIGLDPSRMFSHDAFWVLDGAWRMMNGQRPQMEFSSMQGFLAYVPSVLGLHLSGGTIWGLAYGQALMGIVLTAWTFLLGRNALAPFSLALLCLCICATAASPFCIGLSPFELSPALTYNRYGYCGLALVLLEAVVEPNLSGSRRDFLGGFSTGAIVVALFFMKITFGIAALLLTVLLFWCRRQSRSRLIGLCAGFALVLFLCLLYYSFDLKPMAHDLYLVAKVRKLDFKEYPVNQIVQEGLIGLVLCAGAATFTAKYGTPFVAMRLFIAGLVGTLCAVCTPFGDGAEFFGLALLPFVAIVLADLMLRYTQVSPASQNLNKALLLLLTLAMTSGTLIGAVVSDGFAFYDRYRGGDASHMRAPRLEGFATNGPDRPYAGFVNDGLDLIQRLRKPSESLMCLDFSNPFSYGLGIKPAPGGTNGLHFDNSFNLKYHLSPYILFGQADLVMIPKHFSDGRSDNTVDEIYGSYLAAHFELVGVSRDWKLYRKRPPTGV